MAKKQSTVGKVPQLVVAGRHEHAGARAVTNWTTLDPECAFCGSNFGVIQVSKALVNERLLPMFDAMGTPLWMCNVEQIDRRCAKLSRLAAAAPPRTAWENESLSRRAPPKPAPRQGSRSPSERAGQEVFTTILEAGPDWLSAVRSELSGERAAVAVDLLSLREPCRAAWQFNPALPIDDWAVVAYEAFRTGRLKTFELRFPDLEARRVDLLLDAWSDERPEVQDAAVTALGGGHSGFGAPGTEQERWKSFSKPQRERGMRLYDKDADALDKGVLTTANRPWRESRLKSMGKVVEALRT
ncbi:hypothetical protein [Chondromyces apiculatus]|uniref:Uncharacterized protein n=1 Tax=Chondromyces apiculatus DSM 436 TaxID=1192034 RepID=A0A017TI06_9BACT|nr:hypothetical protein [Chondromyces apiculatus]EYF08246.1 Hypothetical protein CAP_6007 [Chondromyces apiculatus DSM 436]